MALAKASEFQKGRKLRWPPLLAVIALGVWGAVIPARSECQSPSTTSGATTTTVYRCPDENTTGMPSAIVVDPEKTTEVERGSADQPWFGPKPTKTADPIQTLNPPLDKKEDAAPAAPAPVQATKSAVTKVETSPSDKAVTTKGEKSPPDEPVTMEGKATPTDAQATTEDDAAALDAPATNDAKASPADTPAAEVTKKKMVKPKEATAKAVKAKPAKKKLVKIKRSKTKLAKAKPDTTKTVAETKPAEPAKSEPATDDGKVVVWTKKDMGLGNRIKNWLGF